MAFAKVPSAGVGRGTAIAKVELDINPRPGIDSTEELEAVVSALPRTQ